MRRLISKPSTTIKLALVFFPFLLFSLGLNIYFFRQIRSGNTVIEVIDGDTFQLKSGKRVRLLGVDAPEYNRCGGEEGKKRLEELILGKIVKLDEETPEAYGRSLALVYAGSVFVNKVMLKEGWGRTDYRKNSQREVLTAAYHLAENEKRGILSNLCRQSGQVTGCNIKGNIDKNTYEKFYHLPGCRHYDEVVIEKDIGEGYFCTEEEASAAGFKKASGCP